MTISATEASFLQESLRSNFRADGRNRLDFRALSLALNVAPSANSSARCCLGGTDVLAACRLEVEDTHEGGLEVFVECTPASLAVLDGDVSVALAAHLQALFGRTLCGEAQLAILPGRRAWVVYLDLTILAADGGNLVDAASCAARYALADLRVPRTRTVGYSDPAVKGASVDGLSGLLKAGNIKRAKGKGRAMDFDLDSYYDEGVHLRCAHDLPMSITLNLLGDLHFVDATLDEQRCTSSRLVVGADRSERIRLVRQEGELELESDLIERLVEVAAPLAVELIDALDRQREEE